MFKLILKITFPFVLWFLFIGCRDLIAENNAPISNNIPTLPPIDQIDLNDVITHLSAEIVCNEAAWIVN